MAKSILKRIGSLIIVLLIVSLMAFVIMRIAPGDPVDTMLPDTAKPEQIEALREQLGLDQPLYIQYLKYMKGLLTGDLGTSTQYNQPCARVIFNRLPATITIAMLSAIVTIVISVPLGVIAGVKKGSMVDFSLIFFVVVLQSMSVVWTCVLLLLIFVVKLKALPSMGYYGLAKPKYLIMPVIAMSYRSLVTVTRMARSSMIDVLGEDYITCAYARGLSKGEVYAKYALKNSLIPTITIYGLEVACMLAGAVIIEEVFSIPGIGTLLVTAVSNRDYPLIQSTLVITAFMFSLVNLLVDVAITFIDPRIKQV